jgi:hypothetical protein
MFQFPKLDLMTLRIEFVKPLNRVNTKPYKNRGESLCIAWRLSELQADTSWKVAGSISDEVIRFSFDLIFQPHYGPGFDSAFNSNE